MRFTIKAKLLISYLMIIVAIGATGAMNSRNIGDVKDGIGWNRHTFEVIQKMDSIVLAMVNQENGGARLSRQPWRRKRAGTVPGTLSCRHGSL